MFIVIGVWMRKDLQRSPAVGTYGGTMESLGGGTLLEERAVRVDSSGNCQLAPSPSCQSLKMCSLCFLLYGRLLLYLDKTLPLNYKKKNEEKLARFVRDILKSLSRITKSRSWKFIFLRLRIICSRKITIHTNALWDKFWTSCWVTSRWNWNK